MHILEGIAVLLSTEQGGEKPTLDCTLRVGWGMEESTEGLYLARNEENREQ